jgi:hypothetical protein
MKSSTALSFSSFSSSQRNGKNRARPRTQQRLVPAVAFYSIVLLLVVVLVEPPPVTEACHNGNNNGGVCRGGTSIGRKQAFPPFLLGKGKNLFT